MLDRIELSDGIGFVAVTDGMGSDLSIVKAARVSYNKHGENRTEEQDKKLLRYLFTEKPPHVSPFEQGKIQFNIRLPIFVMRQLVRTRCQNLNEESLRYKEAREDFFTPKRTRKQAVKNKQASGEEFSEEDTARHTHWMRHAYLTCLTTYRNLLNDGVARELARIVLPFSLYTEIVTCMDMNNLVKFFNSRIHPGAQKEIEDYAVAMLKLTRERFPWCIELLLESNEYIRGKVT